MTQTDPLICASENIHNILSRHRVDCVVIGAIALAAFEYVRQTDDLDLGVVADIMKMRELVQSLEAEGFAAELREPDGNDPLAGVIDVTGPFGLIQIISFADRFPAVIEDAIRGSTMVVREGSPLCLPPLPQLIALKLYAGGSKSRADIVEVLNRNPDVDLDDIRNTCKKYRLRGIEPILKEVHR